MKDKKRKKRNIRWTLVLYDLLVFALAAVLLALLQDACDTGDDDMVREALRKAVPTFRKPEEVNREADLKEKAEEKGNYKLKKSGYKIAAL